MSGGYDTSFAITSDGTIYGWGSNQFGQLGDNNLPKTQSNMPTIINPVPGKKISQISSGFSFSVFLTECGGLYSAGTNTHSEIGHSLPETCFPVEGSTKFNFRAISANWQNSVALTNQGTKFTWGSNSNGQLEKTVEIKNGVYSSSYEMIEPMFPQERKFTIPISGFSRPLKWEISNHHLFEKAFQDRILLFLCSIKRKSELFKIKFPKPILYHIINFSK
eukprot:TRINITY_DN1574_c0_g1_i2.p1 TRINITY_DN1574_c0_g1~~TRINITY_DN1574_c0_g1_i2.p1  ORF type:complete len:220 (-),score=49.15 TRINITY_DN1574_c0_g1_i2:276-935(-)